MKKISSAVLALIGSILLAPAAWAQGAIASVPESRIDASTSAAVVAAAKIQLEQDEAVYKSDRSAARAACRNKTPDCESAKAKLKADRAALNADQESFWRLMRASGGQGRVRRRRKDARDGGATP